MANLAGYSGTPLVKKMGIKEATKILLMRAPADYQAFFDADMAPHLVAKKKDADMIHIFATKAAELEKDFYGIIQSCNNDTVIWISWYKKSAGMVTDITEDTIRKIVLATDWVDIKVCAVSEKWSGLKIVKRKNKRG